MKKYQELNKLIIVISQNKDNVICENASINGWYLIIDKIWGTLSAGFHQDTFELMQNIKKRIKK